VVADFTNNRGIRPEDLETIGYRYDGRNDKWHIGDAAADYIYAGNQAIGFALPGTLKLIGDHTTWLQADEQARQQYFPLYRGMEYLQASQRSAVLNFVSLDTAGAETGGVLEKIRKDDTVVLCLWSSHPQAMSSVRRCIMELIDRDIRCPVILAVGGHEKNADEQLIHFSTEAGALFLDGMGDGIWLMNEPKTLADPTACHRFLNNTAFTILQATRTRISKTEYISCPSCGRTLFDLQETTARIRSVTHHLKGVKIAIMGCIVNGPGEMADADFGYVGSGPGKITLYKGKDVVKRGVDSAIAVEELINLLKESDAWIDPLVNEKMIVS
jgi:(E)-4-hydroxy-3-methylbut-2-enyl-diphosphate synthase